MQPISRRQFLAVTATAGLAGGCSLIPTSSQPVHASSPAVAAAEARRRRPGARVHQLTLTAAPVSLDLAGREVTAWAYNHTVPGPALRVRAGEVLRVHLVNQLPEATTIHWHGIRLRNDMDGVPGVTQPPIGPGGRFTYEFTVPDPGTYFFHAHLRLQLDRGLYAALLVDDPAEPGGYDDEAVVVLVAGVGQDGGETTRTFFDEERFFPILIQHLQPVGLDPTSGLAGPGGDRVGRAGRGSSTGPEGGVGAMDEGGDLLELFGSDLVAHWQSPGWNRGSILPTALGVHPMC